MMDKETVEQLKAGRARIQEEGCWTQEAFARNERGDPVLPDKGAAWCALGAVDVVNERQALIDRHRPMVALLCALQEHDEGWRSVAAWNDAWDRTHAEVLALYDRAIEREEAR